MEKIAALFDNARGQEEWNLLNEEQNFDETITVFEERHHFDQPTKEIEETFSNENVNEPNWKRKSKYIRTYGCYFWAHDLFPDVRFIEGPPSFLLSQCFRYSAKRGYHLFAVKRGRCLTGHVDMYATIKLNCAATDLTRKVRILRINDKRVTGGEFTLSKNQYRFRPIGCYKEKLMIKPSIPIAENRYSLLEDNWKRREHPRKTCAKVAVENGFKVFGITRAGMCLTGPEAEKTYKKYGRSRRCILSGTGGVHSTNVYSVKRLEEKDLVR